MRAFTQLPLGTAGGGEGPEGDGGPEGEGAGVTGALVTGSVGGAAVVGPGGAGGDGGAAAPAKRTTLSMAISPR